MKTRVTTFPTYKHANKAVFYKKTAVVIDLLRAASTITAVLSKGCIDVIPVEKIGDAFAVKNSLADGRNAYCGGERDGVKIEGYDFGNSPIEYPKNVVCDSHIILCTTNGTQAIAKAVCSDYMFMGCLNNASAAAHAVLETERDVVLLCSGTKLNFSCDDIVAAGAILERMEGMGAELELDDLSSTALYLYRQNRHDLKAFIEFTTPYKILTALGAEADIDYCLKEDISQNVPMFEKERIVNLREDSLKIPV